MPCCKDHRTHNGGKVTETAPPLYRWRQPGDHSLEGAEQPAARWRGLSRGAHYTHLSPNLPSRTSLWSLKIDPGWSIHTVENDKHYKCRFSSKELIVKHYSIILGILENGKQRIRQN